MHVPRFVHAEFQRLAPPDFNLTRWYAATDLAWSDQAIGDDAPTFWRARWREEHGTTQRTDAQIKRQVQRTRPRVDKATVRPAPPPLTPERQAELEADAIRNGYRKRDDGQWVKSDLVK